MDISILVDEFEGAEDPLFRFDQMAAQHQQESDVVDVRGGSPEKAVLCKQFGGAFPIDDCAMEP
jgi:hypothetical protein